MTSRTSRTSSKTTNEKAMTTTNSNTIQTKASETTVNATTDHAAQAERQEHPATPQSWQYRPDADIIRENDQFTILMDVPGVHSGDIDLQVDRGVLTVHARVSSRQRRLNGRRWLVHEYGVGDYFRSFELDDAIDPTDIQAECTDGVLRITLPKHESARPRRIEVRDRASG